MDSHKALVTEVRGKKLALTLVVVIIFVGGILGYLLYSAMQPNLSEISKQSPRVQSYLQQHPNAKYELTKCYLATNGTVYDVDENWRPKEVRGSAGEEPMDGKGHYCWVVHWYDPTSMIEHIINVWIDKDTLEIILVTEAW